MTLTLHTLTPAKGSTHRRKRLGRGNASGHGAYSTRGIKGQRARQGGRKGLGQLGVKHFVSHLPKVRGFQSFKTQPAVIKVADLRQFASGTVVTAELLRQKGLATDRKLRIKLIGSGKLEHPITVVVNSVTPGAREAVEKAGGKVEIIPFASTKAKK
ncbi:MAG: 50S ribosomal protein L15 [Candidatus Kerfeldbacteria bacterium]|nr:50S ribosomal protein L15 [Candidatus Kerfeldbacteria bacterium]